jgi:hypothetical protein
MPNEKVPEEMGGDPPCHLHEVWDPDWDPHLEVIDRLREKSQSSPLTDEEEDAFGEAVAAIVKQVRRERAQEAAERRDNTKA